MKNLILFLWFLYFSINSNLSFADESIFESIKNGTSLSSLKIRYEHVNQDGKSKNANAITTQTLLGWKTKPYYGLTFLLQGIGVTPLTDNYNGMKKGVLDQAKANYPVVADPEDYNINQAYINYSLFDNAALTLGRQAMVLDNWRFIGDVRFRQNLQVMDGLSFTSKLADRLDIFLGHMENVRQITTKNQDAKIELINVKYALSAQESISGYAYLVDWQQTSQQSKSDQTYGLRLVGQRPMNANWNWMYTAEYADQSDYKDGSKNIDNFYYRFGLGMGQNNWSIRYDQEKLSSNPNGQAFQTNLGTNHLFQGWADQFLTTPNAGIVDHIISAKANYKELTLKTEYHLIYSDRNFTQANGLKGDFFGRELDIGIYYPLSKNTQAFVEYANFNEADISSSSRKRDTEKVWLTFIYKF